MAEAIPLLELTERFHGSLHLHMSCAPVACHEDEVIDGLIDLTRHSGDGRAEPEGRLHVLFGKDVHGGPRGDSRLEVHSGSPSPLHLHLGGHCSQEDGPR